MVKSVQYGSNLTGIPSLTVRAAFCLASYGLHLCLSNWTLISHSPYVCDSVKSMT